MSLTLTDVTLTYPDGRDRLTALDEVSLHVPRGSLVAVTGPSGSGKSSLLAVAGALVSPDRGTVRVDDAVLTGRSPAELARIRRERIGFVFQQDNLLPALTAVDQILLAADIRGRRRRDYRRAALDLLDEVGLARFADRRPHELSGGMRQRVNIARALFGDPSLLLIDEPTSALDSELAAEVIALLGRLIRERDLAAVLVTHDLVTLATGDVDTITHMRDGVLSEHSPRSAAPLAP